MGDISGLTLGPLTAADVDAAMLLSSEAGWNQLPSDWRLIIAHGDAVGLKSESGALVASIVSFPYGRSYGWLAMLLVAQSHRKRGLGSFLFEHGLNTLQEQKRIAALDATPAGEQLYTRYGFRCLYRIYRMERSGTEAPAAGDAAVQRDTPGGEVAESGALRELLETDAAVTGFERAPLLQGLYDRPGSRLFRTRDARGGIALLRRGRRAWHIGPLYAQESSSAIRLIDEALAEAGAQSIYIDVAAHRDTVLDYLGSLGFVRQRPFARMLYGGDEPAAAPPAVVATAGPEYG